MLEVTAVWQSGLRRFALPLGSPSAVAANEV